MKIEEFLFYSGSFAGGPVAGFWFWGPFEHRDGMAALVLNLLAVPLYAVFPGIVIGAILSLPIVVIRWRIDTSEEQERQNQKINYEIERWRQEQEYRQEENRREQERRQEKQREQERLREETQREIERHQKEQLERLRQKQIKAKHRRSRLESLYGSILAAAIENSEPIEGMEPDMVKEMWGNPHRVQEEKLKTKSRKIWTWYEDPKALKKRISKKAVFTDGVLTTWEIR